jgi:hypothetical protein
VVFSNFKQFSVTICGKQGAGFCTYLSRKWIYLLKKFDLAQVPAVVIFDCAITNNNKKRNCAIINNYKANESTWQEVQKLVLSRKI